MLYICFEVAIFSCIFGHKDKKVHFGSQLSFKVHVKFKSTKMTSGHCYLATSWHPDLAPGGAPSLVGEMNSCGGWSGETIPVLKCIFTRKPGIHFG